MKKILLTAALCLMTFNTAAGERVPGTQVSIDAPEGFQKTNRFPGYIHEEAGASIMVTEIPGPYSQVTKKFNERDLGAKGMKLIEKKPVNIQEHDGLLLNVAQSAHGREFMKWLLVFGSEQKTILVTAAFPRETANELSEKIKSSLLSVEWHAGAGEDILPKSTFKKKGGRF